MEQLKKEFNYIIINNSIESFFDINKISLEKSEKINVLINKNIKDLIFFNNLLKIYKKNLKINLNKFNIIIYKTKNKIIKINNIIPYSDNLEKNNNNKIFLCNRRYFGINK